jgi:hypothetical protein
MDLRLATLKAVFLFAVQCFNIESMQEVFLSQLCVNTLTATKVTLITYGI